MSTTSLLRMRSQELSKEHDISKEPGKVYYLLHHLVVRRDKETTKVSAVFDASCLTNKPSLSDCLYSGPKLLSKIFDILIRFRMNYIGILADIQQAFLNVKMSDEHKDFLRFLWVEDLTENEARIVYRVLRVVFGVKSSPFLLNGTIRHHLMKYLPTEREFIEEVSRRSVR